MPFLVCGRQTDAVICVMNCAMLAHVFNQIALARVHAAAAGLRPRTSDPYGTDPASANALLQECGDASSVGASELRLVLAQLLQQAPHENRGQAFGGGDSADGATLTAGGAFDVDTGCDLMAAAQMAGVPISHLGSARPPGVLMASRCVAAAAGPFVPLPPRLVMPSAAQRRWVSTAGKCCVAMWALTWLWRHSRLSGSDDLEQWLRTAVTSTKVRDWP
eukprot:358445-Chlamydomonas_euryale.AAC.30